MFKGVQCRMLLGLKVLQDLLPGGLSDRQLGPMPWRQVSLYGHSLGSVLIYDILCHQELPQSLYPLERGLSLSMSGRWSAAAKDLHRSLSSHAAAANGDPSGDARTSRGGGEGGHLPPKPAAAADRGPAADHQHVAEDVSGGDHDAAAALKEQVRSSRNLQSDHQML